MESKPLRTLCMTCSGTGDLDTPVAYQPRGTNRVQTGVVSRQCWICGGEGWLTFARRRTN